MTASSLQESVVKQREMLTLLLGKTMHILAKECAVVMTDRPALESLLAEALPKLRYCKHLYVLDATGLQTTVNITRMGPDPGHYGRNRSDRPYMQGISGGTDFKLSSACQLTAGEHECTVHQRRRANRGDR